MAALILPSAEAKALSAPQWNQRVSQGSLFDIFGDVLPPWQAWRAQALRAQYRDEIGPDATLPMRAIVDRIITLQASCDYADAQYFETGAIDLESYARSTRALRTLLLDLGIEKRTIAAGTPLDALMQRRAALAAVSAAPAPSASSPTA